MTGVLLSAAHASWNGWRKTDEAVSAVGIEDGWKIKLLAFARLVVTNVKGYGMAFDPGNWIQHDPANVDVVETAPTSVASLDLPPTEIARPLLEEFWQHFGVWHSPSYDEKGEFIRNR